MIVCITEKPSVAADIAKILGASTRRDGFYEGGNYWVTWTYGHLCTLKEPHDYSPQWKMWSLGALPIIPQPFGIKLIDEEGYQRQFGVIKSLIDKADSVINCGDAGQEGELIQRWVMQKAGCNKPVQRLWISSLTDESITEGFKKLRPQAEFDRLYLAGLSRSIGDWILGINATRLYTLKYAQSRNVLSIGRVQTPTLALIVNRQREIDNFVPEDYWEIKTLYRGVTFNSTKGRYKIQGEAQEVAEKIKEAPLTITDIQKKAGREAPPRLFDLTSLQVECNKKFSFSADVTLKLIQSLYEKKVTTYPRVDTTYLSEDIYPKIPGIMQAMEPYAALTAPVLATKIPKPKRIFDNSKVTDHHAIIPTNVPPQRASLSLDEKRVYDLVAKRFIAAFYPDCEFASTTVDALITDIGFRAVGKQITKPGWRAVLVKDKDRQNAENADSADNEQENGIMPAFEKGESGPHEPSLLQKQTQPPKRYTEADLLRAMETAGKLVDDDDLRDAMKENGIGRPSTRAQIIETLFKRRYIRRERKSLVPTLAGITLIDTIKNELLKSAKLTGLWESKLRQIERGEFEASQFMDELKVMVNDVVLTVLRDNGGTSIVVASEEPAEKKKRESKPRQKDASSAAAKPAKKRSPAISEYSQILCPMCGRGFMMKGRTAFGCSAYAEGCTFRVPFTQADAETTPAKLATIIKKISKNNG